jgi:MFS family permease
MAMKVIFQELRALSADGRLLFGTRVVRMFAYGFLAVVLILYLVQVGLGETEIGLLLTLTLLGDTFISLWITTTADRIGRRRMLQVGAVLMVFAGILFALTGNFILLLLAATIGVISPSGYEVGPFLSIEQAALTQIVPNERRTHIFAWYNLVGSFATALGSLAGGALAQTAQGFGVTPLGSYRMIVLSYAAMGLILGLIFTRRRNFSAGRSARFFPAGEEPFRPASLPGRCIQAFGSLFHRRLRGRVCFAVHRGLLVSRTLPCSTGIAGWYLLRRQHSRRSLGPERSVGGF